MRVVYLGPLRDLAGEDIAEFPAPLNWDSLLGLVPHGVAAQLRMARVNIACRGKVLADKTTLWAVDGDEVALLPPVSGG